MWERQEIVAINREINWVVVNLIINALVLFDRGMLFHGTTDRSYANPVFVPTRVPVLDA